MRRGKAVHTDGTASQNTGANFQKVYFTRINGTRARVWKVRIENTDSTNGLEVSFNNGNNSIPLAAGEVYQGEHDMHYFHVNGNGGTCTFKAIGTSYG